MLWCCAACDEYLITIFNAPDTVQHPQLALMNLGATLAIERHGLQLVDYYPKPPTADDVANLPPEIRTIFDKARTDFNAARLEQACMMLRKVLDKATMFLLGDEGKGQTLNNRIDMLKSRGLLTADLAAWAHTIRSSGNDFVHDAAPTQSDADDMELLTRMFLIYTFSLPAMLAARVQAKNVGGSVE